MKRLNIFQKLSNYFILVFIDTQGNECKDIFSALVSRALNA
jgi:hypothetical protein